MSDIKTNEVPAQELSEILQVRRDKLTALQQEGRDPFEQTKFVRSAYSADIKADYDAFVASFSCISARMMCPSRNLPISENMISAISSA